MHRAPQLTRNSGVVVVLWFYYLSAMKMQFGAIVVAGSGKVGGHVASRNKAGAYLRTKVTPVNPQTTAQVEARNRLTSFSQAWRELTETQRQSWNAAVKDFARTNVFGELKNPSGFNLFQRLNNNIAIGGGAQINVAPQLAEVLALATLGLTADASAHSLTLTFSPAIPAGQAVKIFATPGVSQGKSFVKNEYRLIAVYDDAGVSPLNVGTEWEAKFGALTAGQKLFVLMVPFNLSTGQEGTGLSAFTTVVA